jgi:hypothetical protein
MKKVIIIIVALLVVGAGGYFAFTKGKGSKNIELDKPEITSGLKVMENKSLMGWLKKGKSVECTLSTEEGTITMKTKDNKVRIEGLPYMFGGSDTSEPDFNGVSLTTGDWVYMWSGDKGTKMNIKAMQETMDEEQKEKAEDYDWEETAQGWEALYQYECQEKRLSDDLFEPPTDVEFTDWTEMMANMQQMSQQLQEKFGEGENMNMEDIEEQLEKMDMEELMKKYGAEQE